MAALLSIGEFSRVTHLSVKTLRYYDELALLKPVRTDATTGYRYYATVQLPRAQVISRLRALEMPVADVKAVMEAPSTAERNALIAKHLERLDAQLARTRTAVESLRALLRGPAIHPQVSRRSIPEVSALAIQATVERPDLAAWWHGALGELHATLKARRLPHQGPLCGIYDAGLFQDDRGEALVYVPVEGEPLSRPVGRVFSTRVPGVELAVVTHAGPHDDLDVTCGQLAEHVAAHELGVTGPLREFYLRDPIQHPRPADWLTEIGWPIFRADSGTLTPES